jgi:hypothetical protein
MVVFVGEGCDSNVAGLNFFEEEIGWFICLDGLYR